MKTFKIVDGDYVIENGQYVVLEGKDALKQRVEFALSMFLDEYELAPGAGTDWWSVLGKKHVSNRKLQSMLSEVLLGVDEVTAVKRIFINNDGTTRKTEISILIESEYGDLGVSA